MHLPRPVTAIRAIGCEGARANVEQALAASARDRAAVDELAARMRTTGPTAHDVGELDPIARRRRAG
jgi:hypothetical protein